MLWTVLFTLPLMAAIQIVSARIGYVTRRDLIATVPSYVIQRARARPMLKMLELPFPVPHFEVKQGWRQCNHDDVANRWLRGVTSERFTKT